MKPQTRKNLNTPGRRLVVLLAMLLSVLLPLGSFSSVAYAAGDTTLSTFEINGSPVEDGDNLIVAGGTTEVTVNAVATDNTATVVVTGATGLVTGNNPVAVTVTSADTLSQSIYTVNVFVTTQNPAFSNDASLLELKVNGTVITPGRIFEVAPLTTAVTVNATPNDSNATVEVTGARNLVAGLNTVTATITAEDGTTTQAYSFKVRVQALSRDVALAAFSVNGQAVRHGGRVFLDPGTDSVSVIATPSDLSSSVQISGNTGLVAGANTLTVTVTAPSGDSATYTVTLNVQVPSSIRSLVVFKVSGVRVLDGSTVIVPSGTSAVAVTATPTDPSASVQITGSNNLQKGENTMVVVVTAEDGTSTTYTVTLNVLANDDTSLALFQYDGSDIADGDSFDLAYGTESVEITAEPTVETSTVEILGADALVTGRNIVRVQVTAEDASVRTYRLIFNVAANTDTTLDSITVGGQDASGGSVSLPAGTRAAVVAVVTSDPYATFTVDGGSELVAGENTVTVTVTAADGETSTDYAITVTVEEAVLGTDTSLESVTVGGQDASGGSVSLPAGTRAAVVAVVTSDPYATFTVDGGSELVAGENTVTVTVTAADGETSTDYAITVTVLASQAGTEVGVNSITVAGQDGLAGPVNVGLGTRAVRVIVETTDPFASFTVDGNVDLQPGENTVTVVVTAADGEATAEYTVTVVIPELSDDTSFSVFTVNGLEVGDEPIELAAGTSRVNVKFATTDDYATYMIVGDGKKAGQPLQEGENSLVVTVTAQNGDSADYTVTLIVLTLSTKTDLAEEEPITINGEVVDTELLDQATGYYDMPLNTTRISIGVKAADPGADVFVNDKTVWPTIARQFSVEKGVNLISIEVVPPAGSAFAKTYTLKVYVGGKDATLKTVKVNTTTITFNGELAGTLPGLLANGTTKADLYVEPTVALKSGNTAGTKLEFDGGDAKVTATATANTYKIDGLVTGENTISITVTPGDENMDPFTYTVTINVALSGDKSLKTFLLNGAAVPVGSTKILPVGTEAAELDAVTGSELATFEVSGADELAVGLNTAVITVTAEDGTSAEYKVTVIVLKAVDTIVVPFPKVGVVTVDAKTNAAGNKIIAGEIKKIGTSNVVSVVITNNFLVAKDKPAAGPARATAVQKYLQAQKINGIKTAVFSLVPGAKTQKGTTVTISYY